MALRRALGALTRLPLAAVTAPLNGLRGVTVTQSVSGGREEGQACHADRRSGGLRVARNLGPPAASGGSDAGATGGASSPRFSA